MSLIKLFHPYKCKYCGTPYTILQGRFSWSFLPVEIIRGDEMNDIEFEKNKHVSHLKNCTPLQAQWESVKKIVNRQLGKESQLLLK